MTTHCDLSTRVKDAARGHELELLAAAGIARELLDGRHHPCPKCGGTDRFRLIDAASGALLCNQCFRENNGDWIAAAQWFRGWDFPATLAWAADYLDIPASDRKTAKAVEKATERTEEKSSAKAKGIEKNPAANLEFRPWSDGLAAWWCIQKPGVTPEAIQAAGGRLALYRGQYSVVAVPIRQPSADPVAGWRTVGWVIWDVSGLELPTFRRGEKEPAEWVKMLTTYGSGKGLVVIGDQAAFDVAKTVLKTEGPTDAMALWSAMPAEARAAIAVATNAGGAGEKKLPQLLAPLFRGKTVHVCHDADQPGQAGVGKWAAALAGEAAAVRNVLLPFPMEKDHGRDLRDFLVSNGPAAWMEFEKLLAAGLIAEPAEDGRTVIIGTDESRVVNEGIAALATCENVYQRGGCLVQVVEGVDPPKGIARPKDAPRIAPIRQPRLRELLSDAATWAQKTEDGLEKCHPPEWTVKAVDARGQWTGIPGLTAVVETPILRADGTVLTTPGYDQATGIIFRARSGFPPIPELPARADALRSVQTLLEVAEDFPFATDAHRAAWLASTITPLARYAFHGPTPIFLIDANVRGCGKSLLTDVTSLLVAAREMARMALPRDDDEFRKRITALAVAGEPLILIDNIVGTLGSASLDAALTATSWSDRILGQSAMASGVPLYAVWFATGNNVILAADTARRALHIRLESPEENPEERSGFHHADLLGFVRTERPRLAAAAVTILAAYCAAGRPDMHLTPWGSYEAWSALVRQALVWCDLPDPAETRTELRSQADREAATLRQLVAGWEEADRSGAGMTVAAALKSLVEYPNGYDALRSALWELSPPKDGKALNPRSIGMKLHHLRRRVVGGKYFDQRMENNTAVWFLADGTTGAAGTKADPLAGAGAHAHTRKPGSDRI